MVDLDFRYNSPQITTRQHAEQHISDMVIYYIQLLKEHCIVPTPDDPIVIYIMEKPNVNILSDANVTKDGIHMFVSLAVDRDTQKKIREKMLTILPNSIWKDLPITNTWKDVLNEGITKGKTNWTLYGSRKPGHEAYQLTHSYSFSFSTDDDRKFHLDFTQQEYFNTLLSGQGLSVQSTYVKRAESRGDKNTIIAGFVEQAKLPPKKRNADEIEDSSSSSSSSQKIMRTEPTLDATRLAEYQKLEYFFQNGFSSANYNHEDMCKIGYGIQAMFGIDNGLSLYLSVAKKYSSNMDWEDEYTKKFQKHLKPKHDWNMGFFMNLFQRVNKELYQKMNKNIPKRKSKICWPKERRIF